MERETVKILLCGTSTSCVRVYTFLLGYNPSFLGAQGTQKSRKFAVNVSKRSRGFTMNLEQASRRVEPVRMFTRNGGNFYRVSAVTRNLPATIFRPRALLRKCTPYIYYVFRASWTFIFASVLHRSLLRHVRRRIDFCVILSSLFLSSFKSAGFIALSHVE